MTVKSLIEWNPIAHHDAHEQEGYYASVTVVKDTELDRNPSFTRLYEKMWEFGCKIFGDFRKTNVTLTFLQMSFPCDSLGPMNRCGEPPFFQVYGPYRPLFKVSDQFIRSVTFICRHCEAAEEVTKTDLFERTNLDKDSSCIVLDYLFNKITVK